MGYPGNGTPRRHNISQASDIMNDYEALLKKAHEQLPDNVAEHTRFTIPEVDVIHEGNMTILRNFRQVANVLRREEDRLFTYLLNELGTSGSIDGLRATFKGKTPVKRVQQSIDAFVSSYVLCTACGKPDSHLERKGRTLILQCDACGAHHTVKHIKAATEAAAPSGPTVGETIEVHITQTGKKGDGMAKIQDYLVFVPGSRKGDTVKVKIGSITGKIIQANPV